jgi:methionine-rich copper-binding protein CopC
MRKVTLRSLSIIFFCASLLLLSPDLVFAHAKLEKSIPGQRSALKRSPERVKLWFNETLEAAFSSAQVMNENGAVLNTAPARVDSSNGKLLVIDVPPLMPGIYSVQFQVLSIDGHVVKSNFQFSILQQPDKQ